MLYFARWKVFSILGVVLAGLLFAAPNLVPKDSLTKLPGWLPNKQINLGLDLRGGSHLLMEVDVATLIAERLENLQDDIRKTLREKRIGYAGLRVVEDSVRLSVASADQHDTAVREVRRLIQPSGVALLGAARPTYELVTDGNELILTMTEEARREAAGNAVEQSIEIIRRRIDELGTSEPVIQRQGNDRIIVQLPGVKDPTRLKELIGQTAKMTFRLVDVTVGITEALAGRLPPGTEILYTTDDPPIPYVLQKRAAVTGENLKNAQPQLDSQGGGYVVTFTLDTAGARRFAEITRQNVGRQFAIVLDDDIISAPVIREPIPSGNVQISGNFGAQEANDLAILLRAGALPAPLNTLEERTVGAELGADSVASGEIAAVIGSIAVIIFVAIAYGLFGLFANLALIGNVILVLGTLSLLQATLTLPGIAGIVLTVGMAVDANVLIFERIKEELLAGKSPLNGLESGFSRAFATILDANITTLIAAAILFQMGSGPVRGFAVTLSIGVVTTVFTAYTLTRLLVGSWARAKRPKRLPIDPRPREDGTRPWFRLVPDVTKWPFMAGRRIGFAISIGGAILSVVLVATAGLNFGIDFRGGTLLEVSTAGPADLGKIRSVIGGLGLGDVQVQEFGAPDDVLIRVETQPGGDAAQQEALVRVQAALDEAFSGGMTYQRTEVVGPKVGGELVEATVLALAIAMGLMMVYIWFRFEWQFGVGALLALFHDVFLTIGVFSLFQIEFGLSIVAALLTIIGYSMNDTVVIYDRIRENLRKYKRMEIKDLIDLSLNETLSRTVMTGLTTLLALGALYIFGGTVIRGFTFAMIWGVIVGTYSSLFIAAPFLLLTGVKRDWSGVEEKKSAPARAR